MKKALRIFRESRAKPMPSPSPERVKQVINAFYEEDPSDPEAWLEDRCGGDEALRQEVESLLRADAEGPLGTSNQAADWLPIDIPEGDRPEDGGLPEELSPPESPGAPPPTGLPTEALPSALGPYRLTEEIGVGGMSTVYRAERADGAFDRAVAVKLLQRRLRSSSAEERFQAERQVLASLDHPGIAQLIDGGVIGDADDHPAEGSVNEGSVNEGSVDKGSAGEGDADEGDAGEDGVSEGGRPYLVMEYVDGAPITEYATERGLGLEERLDLLIQVAEAVQAAHRQLVVHRDLKPSNVLVTETGAGAPQVKLLDFGIAKLLGDTLPVTRPETQAGRAPMTLAYAAPEQVTGGDISTQTDVYQLGVLAYELLAGERPFDFSGASLAEKEQKITEEVPPPPSRAHESDVPIQVDNDLSTIVLKALRKEPGRRYSSAEAFAEDLRRYRWGEPVEARPATFGYRARKFVERNAPTVAGAAAALLVVAGLTAFYIDRISKERNRAQREARKAEAVADYLTDLLQSTRPDASAADTVTAADMLRRGRRRIDRLDGQPAVKARMLQLLGNAHRERAEYNRAAQLLRRSLAIRDSLYSRSHRSIANTTEELAHLHHQLGHFGRADSLWREALAAQKALFGPNSPKLWEPLHNLGFIAQRRGNLSRADSLLRLALSAERTAAEPDSMSLVASLQNLALSLNDQGKLKQADSLYRRSLRISRRVHGSSHLSVARGLFYRARLLMRQGRLSASDSLAHRAASIARAAMGPRHPTVGFSLTLRGRALARQGRLKEARSSLQEALSILRERLPSGHDRTLQATRSLGRIHLRTGSYARAEPLLLECLKQLRQQGKKQKAQDVRADLAKLYDRWGRPKKADRHREKLSGKRREAKLSEVEGS